jgi:CHAT domain-containing protein/Tfp pilus assembly protein PilF
MGEGQVDLHRAERGQESLTSGAGVAPGGAIARSQRGQRHLLNGVLVATVLVATVHAKLGRTEPSPPWPHHELEQASDLTKRVSELRKQGRVGDAIPLAKRALRTREMLWGPYDLRLAQSLKILADLYDERTKYPRSQDMFPGSAETCLSCLQATDERSIAVRLRQRVVAIQEAALGPRHPDVAESLIELGDSCFLKGDLKRAEDVLQRALGIQQAVFGPTHPRTAKCLGALADVYRNRLDLIAEKSSRGEEYYKMAKGVLEKAPLGEQQELPRILNELAVIHLERNKYAEAEQLLLRALQIVQVVPGVEERFIPGLLNNLGNVYRARKDYEGAKKLYLRALGVLEKQPGGLDIGATKVLQNLATISTAIGLPAQAEQYGKRANAMEESRFPKPRALTITGPKQGTPEGDANLARADELRREVVRHMEKGEYDAALAPAEKALQIREATFLGGAEPRIAESLIDLAWIYLSRNEHARAQVLFEKARSLADYGNATSNLLRALRGLGIIFMNRAEFSLAEPYFERVLRYEKEGSGGTSTSLARAMTDLGVLCKHKGDYARAATLLQEALKHLQAAVNRDHLAIAETMSQLADLYMVKGDLARAEPLFEEALHLTEREFGPHHRRVSARLNGLAGLFMMREDFASAVPLLQRALRIREGALGPDHPDVASSLNNLAWALLGKGDTSQPEALLERALRIDESTSGPEHPSTGSTLDSLAWLYSAQGNFDRAKPLFELVAYLLETKLGGEHPKLAEALGNLAILHEARGDIASSIRVNHRALEVRETILGALLASGAEEQKQAYVNSLSGETNRAVSSHVQRAPTLAEAGQISLTTILRRKGRVLEAMRDLFQALRQRADAKDLSTIDELARIRGKVAGLTLRGPPEGTDPEAHARALADLREKGRQLEEELALHYAALGLRETPVTIQAVQAAMPAGSALVEYFVYRPFDPRAKAALRYGKPRYVAYVLRPRGELGWADLGESESINHLAQRLRASLSAGDESTASRSSRELEKRVMAPVRSLLGETTEVFLSPDGDLNLLPFGALVDERGEYLVKRYRFTYLSSGRDLLRLARTTNPIERATILAAPDYGDRVAGLRKTENDSGHRQRTADMGSITFPPLPGTLAEGKRLARALGDVRMLTGAQATEAALKATRGPRIIHLATHGFFLADLPVPNPNQHERGISHLSSAGDLSQPGMILPENPLLRAGLALAGANRRVSGSDDGILTALEAASLDLIGTQLVVLSACETAMGDVRNGEGVYGLRRALVLAGSETQVMTLWRIDDQVTQQLMVDYYLKIGKGLGRSDAMREVTLKMLANPKTANPRYWASFIVSGDPSPLHGPVLAPSTGGTRQEN